MRKNKILEKLLAIILIFTLTSANFAFVTKSFASSLAETIFGVKSDTGHKNVEFEAYFGTEEEKETSVISDVNNGELAISMDLNVKDSGYLKNAKIEIAETAEGNGLNFELAGNEAKVEQEFVSEENSNSLLDSMVSATEENEESSDLMDAMVSEEFSNPLFDTFSGESEQVNESVEPETEEQPVLPEGVQSIEDNVVNLYQISSNSELKIDLPSKYKNESFVNEKKFSNDCLVKFSGIYVDDDGEENEVSREYTLRVSWKDEREVRVESSIEKYIDYEKGVIVQT